MTDVASPEMERFDGSKNQHLPSEILFRGNEKQWMYNEKNALCKLFVESRLYMWSLFSNYYLVEIFQYGSFTKRE